MLSDELSKIAQSSKAHWGYSQDLLDLWREDLTIKQADLDNNWIKCVEVDSKIVGFCMLSISKSTGHIEHFWVLPDFIGQGLGRKLMQALLREAKSRGAEEVLIEADPNAVGFYKKFGAVQIGKRPSKPEGRTIPVLKISLTSHLSTPWP